MKPEPFLATPSPLSRNLQIAFASAVVTLLIVGAISYRGIVASRESDRWVRHSHEVLATLQDLDVAMLGMESSYRGFVLTGDDSYLESYRAGVSGEQQAEATVRALTVDNPEQQRQMPALARLAAEKIQFAETVIGLRRTRGPEAATNVIRQGSGPRVLEAFQGVVRTLQGEERRLLALRDVDVTRRLAQTRTALIVGPVLGLLIAAAAGWSLQRGTTGRGRAEEALRVSEERYRMLLDGVDDYAIFGLDPEGRIVSWNAGGERIKGYTADEIIGQNVSRFFPPEEVARGRSEEVLRMTAAQGRHEEHSMRVRKDGSRFLASVTLTALRDGAGTLRGFSEISRDLSESAESEAKYRGLLEAAPDAMVVVNQDGEIVLLNLQAEKEFGYHSDELVGQKVKDIIPEGFAERLIADGTRSAADALAQQIGTGIELVGRRKDGSEFPIEMMLSPLQNDEGILVTAAIRDISVRKQAERDLGAARGRLHHLVSESPAVIFAMRIAGADLVRASTSENIERLLGYTVAEALAPDWWVDHVHPDEREEMSADLPRVFAEGRLIQEYRFRHRDGSFPWLHEELRLVRDREGRPLEVVGSWSDITERKSVERRLRESEKEYRVLFDSNPNPMWVFDPATFAFLAVNDAAVRLYGFSRDEFLGMTIFDIRPPEAVPALLEYLAKRPEETRGDGGQAYVMHRKKDGTLFEVTGAANPVEFQGKRAELSFAIDVSEKKRLEAQLLQSQKMEAVGRLAAGVAHDFNNSLGVILGYTELLMSKAAEGQQGKLEQILKATQRATGLTRQLLAFSRKQIVDPKVLNLNALSADLEKMLGRLIGEDIDLAIVPGTDLGMVKADPGQLEQVVMNLCVNARDAMPDGGRLRIETANVELGAGQFAGDEPMAAGRYVMLAVSDTGGGMNAQVLSQIFEPFFTTKGEGKGTGLGLAMVYGFVKQSGGYVAVFSKVGQGTTFKIYLPRIDEAQTEPEPEAPIPPRGSKTILLVEDESALRAIAREILEESGYRVLDASGPDEAIAIAHRFHEPIHLLLTDVVMPGMNGRMLATALVAARPHLRVLYMSGYTDDIIAHRGVLDAGTQLLQKPFRARALLRCVASILAEEGVEVNA